MTYTSNAIESQGFKLEASTDGGSPASYTEVKEIKNFKAFNGQASEIDVTHLQSAGKEFRMGLQDWGNCTFDTNYVSSDAGQALLKTCKGTRQKVYFKMTCSNGLVITFTGYVLSLNLSGGVDSILEASYDVRVSGDAAFA